MKYTIFFLLFLGITEISSTYALNISRFFHTPSLPYTHTDMFGSRSHPYTDFWSELSASKVHHVVEVFPKDSGENLYPANIPEYTTDFWEIKSIFPSNVWNTIWYPWNIKKRTQKINLITRITMHEGKQDNDWFQYSPQTNTNNILYYWVESPHDTTQKITIYPVDPSYYWFIDYGTWEYFAFLGDEYLGSKDIQKNGDIPIPPLVLLGSDLDMYDISVETDGDDFTKKFSPKERKLQLTRFWPTYQIASFGELGQTLYTLLPYYEVEIPLKKWHNTVRVNYQSYTSIQEYSNQSHFFLNFSK